MSAVLFLLCWGAGGRAETIYLLHRAGCGDQIRYARTVAGQPGPDYFTYRYPLSPSLSVFLETDGAAARMQATLPTGVRDVCTVAPDRELADRINRGESQVAIVHQLTDGRVRIEPVIAAAGLERSGQLLTYHSPWEGFTLDRTATVVGTNLSVSNSAVSVTLEGKSGQNCSAAFLLRQLRPGTSYPLISYELHPELGILARFMTGDQPQRSDGMIAARSINGQPIAAYFRQQCRFRSGQIATKGPLPPPTPAPSAIVHTVRPGETLYALSRRYGVGIQEIRDANRLNGNTIRVGQQLRIGAGQESTQPVAPASPVVPPPPPPAAIATSSQFHLVQGGETVAALARRFGYTEERFRAFNGLGRYEDVVPGRQLRTSHCSCPPAVNAAPAPPPPPPPSSTYVPSPSAYLNPSQDIPLPEDEEGYALPDVNSPPPIRIVVPPARPVVAEEAPAGVVREQATVSPPPYLGPERDPRQQRTVHLVKEGETLYSIARSYRITVTRLMELNDLGPTEVIAPFQKLYVN
jgi:LysM repeat protein